MVAKSKIRDGIPAALVDCLHRFSDESWRERKRAIEELLHHLVGELPDGESMVALVETLLDGVGDAAEINSRAACHEVLVKLGRIGLSGVVARIESGAPGRRLFVDLLGEMGGESEVPLLVGLLDESVSDENLKAAAISALGRLGGDAAISAICEHLHDESSMLRLYALDALRVAEATVPVDTLAPLLEDPVTRKVTASVLGVGGLEDAVPLLVGLLNGSMRGVRAAAATSLVMLDIVTRQRAAESAPAEMGSDAPGPSIVAEAMASAQPATRERLRQLIDHTDREVSGSAVVLAGMAGDPAALPAVLGRMADPIVFERAVDLVERLGEDAQQVLVQMCETVVPEERAAMYRLIGAVRGESLEPRLLSALLESLEDPSETLASAACEALAKVGDRTAMAPLYRGCGREGVVGEHAAEALAELAARVAKRGRHDDLDLIIGGAWPHSGALASNICRVVGRLGLPRYVPPLVSMLGSSDVTVRVAAANALGGIAGEHEGVAALSFALADEEAQVRACASRSLGQLGALRSYQPLLAATADPTPLVRAAAVQALVAIDNPITLGRMREIILDDDSPTVVVHAIAGLGRSRENQDLILLMSLCSSDDHEVIKAAARAMTGFLAHRATAALLGLLSHSRWDVRWTAAEVLAERGDDTALASLRRARELERDALVGQILDKAIARLVAFAGEGSSG
jgi:HEAT repeat protein